MVIRRYLYKELYFNLIAIIWVLLLLLITNQLVHYLKNAAMGEIPMRTVLQIMALQIPILLGYFLPLACYLSVLLTLGRWSMDRETVVLAACGVSRHQLLRMVMVFASVVALVVAWLMLFVEPRVQEVRTLVLEQAMTQASIDKIIPNRFETLYPNTVFYAQKVDRTTARMQNVFFAIKTWPKPLLKGHRVGKRGRWTALGCHCGSVSSAAVYTGARASGGLSSGASIFRSSRATSIT